MTFLIKDIKQSNLFVFINKN